MSLTKTYENNVESEVITVKDKAGNTITEASGNTLVVNVQQDSDRPVVELSSLSTNSSSVTTL